jgi:CRISPR-associated helicase Cas3/CRISPR-associated endonuclease Cas3-HD
MQWSARTASVWGKLDSKSASWLPLTHHLEHAATMAGLLWDHFLAHSLRALLSSDLRADDEAARTLCCFYAGIHDVGKASVAFALMAEKQGMSFVLDRMRDEGLAVAPVSAADNVRHETVSQLAVRDWLEDRFGAKRRIANAWACVVGGHHGQNPTDLKLREAENRHHVVGTGPWGEVRREILDRMADATAVREHLPQWLSRPLPVRAQALLTAIVVLADWLASNQDYLPLHDTLAPEDRAAVAFATLALPTPWTPDVPTESADALLRARFSTLGDLHARPIQTALLGAALACSNPPLLIVEAPMGGGKTEAALLAAEALAARFGQGGVYIGLPTMATANPMFDRTLAWLRSSLGDQAASVSLAHGKAGLNDTYAGLLRDAWHGHVYDEEDGDRGGPVVNNWLRGRRRAGLADFVVGTIDQGLFAALKAKHVALRHLGLAGKVVVIDEVHAADTYMRQYLKRALAWLGAYRTPVILMSATLPPAQRDEYVAAYAGGQGDREPGATDAWDAYPRLTCYAGSLSQLPVETDASHLAVRLERLTDDPAAVRDLLKVELADGGVAGVICNTVARAQEAHRILREEFGEDTILLHSRFIAPDRAKRERDLVAQLGRDGRRPQRLVVVGTQVLEQSIDVDFDVLVTDLAPTDLILQRIGRLHRHDRHDRPAALVVPVVHLRGVEDWCASPPTPVPGSRAVYGQAALLRAAATLASHDLVTLPHDIPKLVREAYDASLAAPAGWETRWSEAEQQAATEAARARSRAQAYLLADPTTPATLTGWIDIAAGDPERSEEQGRSQVRDSEDSLEVIALWRDTEGHLRLPECAPKHPGALVPQGLEWGTGSEQALAREMATCTLSLPVQLTNTGVIDRAIAELERSADYSGWQASPWIKGQLVLVFGPDDRAHLAEFELHYTRDDGLVVIHPEEKR